MRACYAALRMQEAVRRYAEELRRAQGVEVQIRVGLNSGEVVVRSIGSDLRMDYSAVGQTTHLAARMEQLAQRRAASGSPPTRCAWPRASSRSPRSARCRSRGSPSRSRCYELVGAGAARTRLEAAARRGLTPLRRPERGAGAAPRRARRGRARGTARWWPWSGSRAWASRGWSGKSPTPTVSTAGWSCSPPRSPTARPRPTSR